MKVEALSDEKVADFVAYCKRYKTEIDDSFLYDEDLRDFVPDEENPTYIAVDEQDEIIGTASLIIDDYNRRGKKGRFRIFHSKTHNMNCYNMLMSAVLKHRSGFAKLQGSETPQTAEQVAKMAASESNIEGGMMILYHNDKPVGVVRGEKDEYENSPIMNIGPLAIIPEYQGKGLGRILLRAFLRFAKEKGYDRTILCVNAENERAKALYLQEGFKQVEAVVCYKYDLV